MKRSSEQTTDDAAKKLKLDDKKKLLIEKKRLIDEKMRALKEKGMITTTENTTQPPAQDIASLLQFVPQRHSSSLANTRHSQQTTQQAAKLLQPVIEAPVITEKSLMQSTKLLRKDPHFDRSITSHAVLAPLSRAYKPMTFNAPGKHIREAEASRLVQAKRDELERIAGEQFVNKSAIEIQVTDDPVVDVEWWDVAFVPSGYTDDDCMQTDDLHPINVSLINDLIHHPIPHSLPRVAVVPQQLHLTKPEQKKLRRLNRLQNQAEEKEKIALGLTQEKSAKLTLKNFMKGESGEGAVLNPTEAEAKIRSEVEGRRIKGILHDQEGMLTKEEKREKIVIKQSEDLAKGIHVCLFRIKDMSDNAHLYKISINAKQLGLVGFSLKYTHMNLVCVQGGLKAIKAYKKLLMKRIKWDGMNATGEDGCGAYCRICWEGTVERADFKFWSDKSFACEVDAVDYLVKNGVGGYWDTAKSFSWDE